MSFKKNQGRKPSQAEAEYWGRLAIKALENSPHWNKYFEKLASFEDLISEGVMPLDLIKGMLEEIKKMKN
jgi:hypothetical protein